MGYRGGYYFDDWFFVCEGFLDLSKQHCKEKRNEFQNSLTVVNRAPLMI